MKIGDLQLSDLVLIQLLENYSNNIIIQNFFIYTTYPLAIGNRCLWQYTTPNMLILRWRNEGKKRAEGNQMEGEDGQMQRTIGKDRKKKRIGGKWSTGTYGNNCVVEIYDF